MQYKFLIYISYSYSLPIGLPLEKVIQQRGYQVQWFSDHQDGKTALGNKKNVLADIKDVIDFQPHIVLTATDDVPDFISGIKVQVFHGFLTYKRPEKKNGEAHFRIRGFFDLYCTQGPTSTNGFLAQQEKHPYFEVIETGWSKVDPLFPSQNAETKVGLPTIFIASTFTKRLSLAYIDNVFNEIKTLSNSGKYRFIMVLHPKLPEDIKQKWQALNNDYFKYYNTTDLVPLFKKADIMFADTTSAIQEFLLQNKPVVTFNHTFDHNYLINISDASKIKESFETAITKPQELINNIATFVDELHPYYDGKSSERIIDETIKFLHKDKNYLKNKPLNLIRKYKIRKRLNHFTFKSFIKPFTLKHKL